MQKNPVRLSMYSLWIRIHILYLRAHSVTKKHIQFYKNVLIKTIEKYYIVIYNT